MKVQDLNIETGIYNKKGKLKEEPLALLYSILKDDIDNASDLESFLQNVVEVVLKAPSLLQIRAVPSRLAVAIKFPSGLKLALVSPPL